MIFVIIPFNGLMGSRTNISLLINSVVGQNKDILGTEHFGNLMGVKFKILNGE